MSIAVEAAKVVVLILAWETARLVLAAARVVVMA